MKTTFLTRFFCSSSLVYLASSMATGAVQAQSSCSSDQQPVPIALLERFISADCSDCWTKSSLPNPAKLQAHLDWIVPSAQGDEAALSSAATNDAAARLQALKLAWVSVQGKLQTSRVLAGPVNKPVSMLRVAHGLPVNGYIGASIEFKPSVATHTQKVQAYLVLIETLAAGKEGSNVERNLVRNVLITDWDLEQQLTRSRSGGFKPLFESRPISLPQGVNPDRLRVLGWVQNAQGQVLAFAQSRCSDR